VFSIWNRDPFAFSVFVLKTQPNVGDPVAQLRFNRMNHNYFSGLTTIRIPG